MWYKLRMSPETDPEFVRSATELLESTSRNIILTTGAIYFAWHLLATATWPAELGRSVWSVTPVVALALALALWLLPRQLFAAQAVWQIGLAIVITMAVYVFERQEVAFFYTLLPLMAVVTVGWPGGLLAEALVIASAWRLAHDATIVPLFPAYSLVIVAGGALTGLLGWASGRALLTVTQWSFFSFEQARKNMEEAREQRVELKQIQEDLLHANRELARVSDRLQVMHQMAEEARRAKEEFVANVSHELRTPLNMIIGFSEIVTQSPQVYGNNLPPALLADIAAIQRNSQHLSRLVDDVLDLSQIDAGRMALSKERACLREIINAAILAVQPLFESKGFYLRTEVPPDLPPVFCDSTRIRQVVINLLSNAGRFTEHGGVLIRVERQENAVVVSVSDTGPGIPPEHQEKLFAPFQQLDGSIRRRHSGSGLGLSISKRFVEMHDGKMWLESEVGVGTTIYFSLPLKVTLSAIGVGGAQRWFNPYRQYDKRTRRSKAPTADVIPPRFVLMEESDTMRRLFDRYLDDVEVTSVQDIASAIRELSHSPAQALVVNTPSFQEMPELADLPYDVPAVTCWVPGGDDAAHRLGVVRYLVKPVTRETLFATLKGLGEGVETVLLVDDKPEVLQLFGRMLSSADRGYRVLRATGGQQALDLLRERQPDVMLLDLIMPGMDGFQVLQDKSQDPTIRDIPVVIISATDPSGEPIVSDTLTVTHGGGLSVRALLACIQAVSEVLAPSTRPDDQGQPEILAA